MDKLTIGMHICHPIHGEGVLTHIGNEYLGMRFDSGGEVLIKRASLESPDLPAVTPEAAPESATASWPESTFHVEPEDSSHYPGSHWEPFYEDSSDMLKRLPEILPEAMLQTGYGEHYKSPRSLPETWGRGFHLVWPLRKQGVNVTVRVDQASKQNLVASIYPFHAGGCQTALTMREVNVWEGGCEAQIEASWGEADICFFDTQFMLNRDWYEADKQYDFILTGLAYSAHPAQSIKMPIKQHPEVAAWLQDRAGECGEGSPAEITEIDFSGAAIFLPVSEWDRDDYSFRAPIKQVREIKDFLGQDGWLVRAKVMELGDGDADLDIVITRRSWKGDGAPQIGQDIEGRLWLQGYLWRSLQTGVSA